MAVLPHWHPVLRSKQLRDKPVSIRVNDTDLVLFRTQDGDLGCLDDVCPHRRMRLSQGRVVKNCLQCPYHGWSYAADGSGVSPGVPRLHAKAVHYDVTERYDAIWIKPANSNPTFPEFQIDGYYHLGNLSHVALAPLELALDNFTEIEHTGTTHLLFGYDFERMQAVKMEVVAAESSVRTVTDGPSKRLPWIFRLLLGIQDAFVFHDNWTVYFSPVYAVFDHFWKDPQSNREGKACWRIYVFFVPLDDTRTLIQTFAFMRSSYPGPKGGLRLIWPWAMHMVNDEIRRDVYLLDNLSDKNPGLRGMILSRFDRGLGLNRERIDSIYRGLRTDFDQRSEPS
jgi:nitrite reductase/ring-hydroxylating ferredoxin subunit